MICAHWWLEKVTKGPTTLNGEAELDLICVLGRLIADEGCHTSSGMHCSEGLMNSTVSVSCVRKLLECLHMKCGVGDVVPLVVEVLFSTVIALLSPFIAPSSRN